MNRYKILSWLVALAGLWMVIAAFVLDHPADANAQWNAIIVGVVVIVLGAWAAITERADTSRVLNWISVVAGIWLVIAPFVLAYSELSTALWNDIIVGVIIVVLAAWSALTIGSAETPAP